LSAWFLCCHVQRHFFMIVFNFVVWPIKYGFLAKTVLFLIFRWVIVGDDLELLDISNRCLNCCLHFIVLD
jgi:hypothetical protein